ncbi:MAG: SGNH/GDSL hydrolase family protein [Burkholderiales bacterium]|nr:SGNH/GDSL hydrolase family protein [Phycisphaerae bacterium]
MKISRRFVRRAGVAFVITVAVLLVGTEIVGRLIGLCDPPLSVADDRMEYRFAPNQDCTFLGNRIIINQFSQRSPMITERAENELRVLVIGDSIAYGGNQLDQSDIATTRLAAMLTREFDHRRVQVLNASAGSWGPANELAYVDAFGDFGADVSIVILSTQDADDRMTFAPTVGVSSSYPDKKPTSALSVLFSRYIPRFFAIRAAQDSATQTATPTPDPAVMETITKLVRRLSSGARPVIVVMHPQREELNAPDNPAWTAIHTAAETAGATFIDARPTYREAARAGPPLYRDAIHPTSAGQQVLSAVLHDAVLAAVTPKSGQ